MQGSTGSFLAQHTRLSGRDEAIGKALAPPCPTSKRTLRSHLRIAMRWALQDSIL
jgi:hypothetical protein